MVFLLNPESVEVNLWCFIERLRWFCRLVRRSRFGSWCSLLLVWCSRWSKAWGQSLRRNRLPQPSLPVADCRVALSSPQSLLYTRLHQSLSPTWYERTLHSRWWWALLGYQDLRNTEREKMKSLNLRPEISVIRAAINVRHMLSCYFLLFSFTCCYELWKEYGKCLLVSWKAFYK